MEVNRTKIPVIVVTILVLGMNGFGDEISPNDVLKKVAAAYNALETYKAKGTIVAEYDSGGVKGNTETSFSILLKKPNLYLISWTQKILHSAFCMSQSGAVCSDGSQPYFCSMNKCWKVGSDEMALAAATGVSGGAAYTIPSFFLPALQQPAPFSRLIAPKMRKSEKVGEEDCYVICGSSAVSKKEILWVSKTDYLIRKYYRSFEKVAGEKQMPKMTDRELEEAVKSLGLKVTEEKLRNARRMMVEAREEMTGSITELHTDISSPALTKNDFKFALPEGTVLKEP